MSRDLALRAALPIIMGLGAWNMLRRGSERALVLPAPMMMWLVVGAERSTTAPWYIVALAHAGALVVLVACWRQWRLAAQWGVIGCATATLWLQLRPSP